MRTYTATTTAPVRPEALLDVLTDPEAIAVWAPVPFSVDDQSHPRLAEGSRVRVSGRLAGQEIGLRRRGPPGRRGRPRAVGPRARGARRRLRAARLGDGQRDVGVGRRAAAARAA